MKKYIFKILRYSGLPKIFRQYIQRNAVTILLFHEIEADTADKSFSFLRKNYNIIGLDHFIKASKLKNNAIIPKNALIITFDDGLVKNYEMLPVIKKYKIPVTIFLCSSIINTNRHFWYKYKKLSRPIFQLKKLKNEDRLKALAEDGFHQESEYEVAQALTKSQIIEMSEIVNMQSHTKFHPCLTNCDYNEAKNEILESKEMLEKDYGFRINSIAYPNGDYSAREIELAKMAGYDCGLTVDYGFNTIETDLFRLKRLSVNDASDLNELIVKSSGLWAFLKLLSGRTQS